MTALPRVDNSAPQQVFPLQPNYGEPVDTDIAGQWSGRKPEQPIRPIGPRLSVLGWTIV